jgi:hypothetical protein
MGFQSFDSRGSVLGENAIRIGASFAQSDHMDMSFGIGGKARTACFNETHMCDFTSVVKGWCHSEG